MADKSQGDSLFDPTVESGNVPNFTHMSRGYESASSSVAKGIAGVGDMISATATGVDNWFKKNIRDEATATIDTLRDAHIDDLTRIKYAMGDPSLSTKNGLPRDLNAQLLRLNVLGEARATGKVSDTQYYTQLDIMSRGLRAKYPGYREHIDNVVKDVTGVDPANRVIAELRAEIAGRIDPSEKEYNSMVDWATKNGHLPEDFEARRQRGQPYSLDELRLGIANRTRAHTDLKTQQERLAFNKAQGNAVEDDAEKTARQGLSMAGNSLLNTVGAAMNKDWNDLQKLAERATVGKASPEELAQLDAGFNSLRTRYANEARNFLYSKPFGPNNATFSQLLSKEKLEGLMSSHMAQLDFIKDALYNKEYGAILAFKRHNELLVNGAENRILREYAPAQVGAAMKNILGDQLANTLYNTNSKLLTDMGRAVATIGTTMMVEGKPLADIMDKAVSDGAKPEAINQVLTNATTIAVDPKATIQAKTNLFKSLYGPSNDNILSKIKPADQMAFWNRMTSPAMAQVAVQLRDSGDVQSWDQYQKWVRGSFVSLFRKLGQDAQSIVTDRATLDLKWNPTATQFEVSTRVPEKNDKISNVAHGYALAADVILNNQRMKESVNVLNSQIRGILPILKESGEDPTQVVSRLVSNLGIDTSKPKAELGTVTFMEKVAEILKKASVNADNAMPETPASPRGSIRKAMGLDK
jgi:hypothetical protein